MRNQIVSNLFLGAGRVHEGFATSKIWFLSFFVLKLQTRSHVKGLCCQSLAFSSLNCFNHQHRLVVLCIGTLSSPTHTIAPAAIHEGLVNSNVYSHVTIPSTQREYF